MNPLKIASLWAVVWPAGEPETLGSRSVFLFRKHRAQRATSNNVGHFHQKAPFSSRGCSGCYLADFLSPLALFYELSWIEMDLQTFGGSPPPELGADKPLAGCWWRFPIKFASSCWVWEAVRTTVALLSHSGVSLYYSCCTFQQQGNSKLVT